MFTDRWLVACAAATVFGLSACSIVRAADQDIVIGLVAEDTCTLGAPTKPSDGSTGSGLTFDVDEGTNLPIEDLKSRDLTAFCNTASNLILTSTNGKLTTSTTAPAGFDDFIHYTAEAVIPGTGSVALLDTSSASSIGPVQYNAGTTNIALRIKFTPIADEALVSGIYADIFTITINPQ